MQFELAWYYKNLLVYYIIYWLLVFLQVEGQSDNENMRQTYSCQ